MKDLVVSVFQVCSDDSFENNSKKILNLLKVHDLKSVDLCVFPENALYINIDKKDQAPQISLEESFFKEAQDLARENDVVLHLGTLPRYRQGRLYNSSIVIDEKGTLSEAYDKIHLFAAHIGPLDIDEGRSYTSGENPAILDVKGWKVGLSICFDLRFSELFSYYAKNNCDLVLVPAAFFRKTGMAHWELLLRARAVEGQCYVAAPGQVGIHQSTKGDAVRKSYGHSLVVHPWGDVVSDLGGEQEQMETFSLSYEEVQKNRKSIIMTRKL